MPQFSLSASKPDIGPQSSPSAPCRQDEVWPLGVNCLRKALFLNERLVSNKVGTHYPRAERAWGRLLVEFLVPGDDHCYRSGHGFVDIPD